MTKSADFIGQQKKLKNRPIFVWHTVNKIGRFYWSCVIGFGMVWVANATARITKDITVTQLNRTVIQQHWDRITKLLEQTVLALMSESRQWISWDDVARQVVPKLGGSNREGSTYNCVPACSVRALGRLMTATSLWN